MRRESIPPRSDWRRRVESLGFEFHTLDGPYWVDDACYRFTSDEIDAIDDATGELHLMCLEAVAHVVRTGEYEPLGLDARAATLVEKFWRANEPALYGRMDLAFGPDGVPKLLEYNADTPTALFEASVVQWYWLEDTRAGLDQFNQLHERLVARWKEIVPAGSRVHFAGCMDVVEDRVTIEYLAETARQAGLSGTLLDMPDIGFDQTRFVDLDDAPIERLFKLYPWEWMLDEPFAEHLPRVPMQWIEPAWKQVLSNKSLLPLLWRLFPRHPNLLAASHDPNAIEGRMVAKPRFGREGEGVRVVGSSGAFANAETVYQAFAPLHESAAGHALVGSWVIGDAPAGIGVREDDGPITTNTSRFVPHCFD